MLKVHGVLTSNKGVGPCNFEAIVSIIKRLWQPGEVPYVWEKVNITPVFKKGKKDLNLNLCEDSWVNNPGKSVPDTGCQVNWRRSFGVVSMKTKSCLSQTENLLQEDWVSTVFCRMKDSTVDITYLDFGKVFDTVTHNNLINKLVEIWAR